jgi:hypothetical protein
LGLMSIHILDIAVVLLTAMPTIGTLPVPYPLYPVVLTPVQDFLPGQPGPGPAIGAIVGDWHAGEHATQEPQKKVAGSITQVLGSWW